MTVLDTGTVTVTAVLYCDVNVDCVMDIQWYTGVCKCVWLVNVVQLVGVIYCSILCTMYCVYNIYCVRVNVQLALGKGYYMCTLYTDIRNNLYIHICIHIYMYMYISTHIIIQYTDTYTMTTHITAQRNICHDDNTHCHHNTMTLYDT